MTPDNRPPQLTEHQITHPKTAALLKRWQAEKGKREFPSRSDFDPIELVEFLGNLLILHIEPEFQCSWYRLYGTNLVDYFGVELTGLKLKDVPAVDPERIQSEYSEILAARGPIVCRNQAMIGDSIHVYEKLLLPLSADGKAINMILASIYRTED